MDVHLFAQSPQDDDHVAELADFQPSPHRVEVVICGADERQWKLILLDADDSFDVVVHKPNGEREALWTIFKDSGVSSSDYLDDDDDDDDDEDEED